jgi:phage-related protein
LTYISYMIYLNWSQSDKYKIKFFTDWETGYNPVREYLRGLPDKERTKILKYAEFLRQHQGVLGEPYTRHIRDKIRELRVDFGKNRHRVLFFTFVEKNIILLHAFLKKTEKTPEKEINRALTNYYKILKDPKSYDN